MAAELERVIQQNSASTEQLSTTSEQLSTQASHLLDRIAFFTLTNGDGCEEETPSGTRVLDNSTFISPPE